MLLVFLNLFAGMNAGALVSPDRPRIPDAGQALAPYTGDTITTILIILAVSAIALVLLGMLSVVNKRRRK